MPRMHLPADILREYPNIRIDSVREQQIVLKGISDDVVANRMMIDLMNRGVVLKGFHRDEKSLEAIFMNIVGNTEEGGQRR